MLLLFFSNVWAREVDVGSAFVCTCSKYQSSARHLLTKHLSLHLQAGDFYAKSCREWTVVGVSQIALLILDWRKFFLYVWIPHFFAQWAIVSMNMLQHDGCDVNVDLDSR